MNLFRSEDHITRWLGARPAGATITVAALCNLAHAWWADRLSPDWTPRTREQSQAILEALGLHGDFWRLPTVPANPT